MKVDYRTGKKKDSQTIAELIRIASGGVVDYLFRDVVPGLSPVQAVASLLKEDLYPHSYRSAVVAVAKGAVVGMALSYPASYHTLSDDMRAFFPANRLAHLESFFTSRVEGSWYIDALGVLEDYRGYGIGKKLIALTKEKAIENGHHLLSLIVFADNDLALPVYQSTGFEIVAKVALEGNDFIPHKGGCLLMKCNLHS